MNQLAARTLIFALAFVAACSKGGGSGSTPLAADFSGTPITGVAPLVVTFTDESTGTVTSWSWDFGDGGAASVQHPIHTYAIPGSYTVALTVSGAQASDTLTRDDYIVVDEPPPAAGFSGTPTTGVAPLSVDFTDESTGAVTGWSWDFGDAGLSTSRHPSHDYVDPGTYSVTLEVTGPGGVDALTRDDYVIVDRPPCPPPTVTSFTVVPDLQYGSGGGCGAGGTCLDLYLPDEPRICSPTVLWLHGGGWTSGAKDSTFSQDLAMALAADGWYVVSVDYTLATFEPCGSGLGVGSYPQAFRDVKQAVDWIHAVGTSAFQLSDEVVVVGSSAGGTLAAMLGTTLGAGEELFDPSPAGDYRVDRVVLFSAPLNFVKGGCLGNPWQGICVTNCPAPPDPPFDCSLPPGCVETGGYAADYPCLADSGNCRHFAKPESFLGEEWPAGGVPPGVECGDPLALPFCCPTMPTSIAWYDASPYFWVSGDEPPFHVLHGECDPLVPTVDAIDFVAALTAGGTWVELLLTSTVALCDAGCGHGAGPITGDDAAGVLRGILVGVYVP